MAWKAPVLSSYTPTPTASTSPQTMTVKGKNFHKGLTVSIGTASNCKCSQFTWTAILPVAGPTPITVTNTDGKISNTMVVTVNAVTPTPEPPIPPIPPDPPTPTPGTLLGQSDFTYLGYYNYAANGLDTPFTMGLTTRYVAGDLRFLNLNISSGQAKLNEFSIAGLSYGDTISSFTKTWGEPFGTYPGISWGSQFYGIWWDDALSRLWSTHTVNASAYGGDGSFKPGKIFTRTLNTDGTISNLRGPIGIENVPCKRFFGGAQPVPAAFQSTYGVGPYAVGWGGYTSVVAQDGIASLGPTMYCIPNPTAYADDAQIPLADYKTVMDCSSGVRSTDWYLGTGAPLPTTFDRGVRLTTDVTNYYDGNDPRPNPDSRPVVPPTPGNWLSPAPDGKGRWTWGDSHYQTGCWINGSTKNGFLLIGSFVKGYGWYESSSLHQDASEFEFHIYDPEVFGQAIAGTRQPWDVKPTTLWSQTFPGVTTGATGLGPLGQVAAACYDATSGKLFVLVPQAADTYINRIYVFQVNA